MPQSHAEKGGLSTTKGQRKATTERHEPRMDQMLRFVMPPLYSEPWCNRLHPSNACLALTQRDIPRARISHLRTSAHRKSHDEKIMRHRAHILQSGTRAAQARRDSISVKERVFLRKERDLHHRTSMAVRKQAPKPSSLPNTRIGWTLWMRTIAPLLRNEDRQEIVAEPITRSHK